MKYRFSGQLPVFRVPTTPDLSAFSQNTSGCSFCSSGLFSCSVEMYTLTTRLRFPAKTNMSLPGFDTGASWQPSESQTVASKHQNTPATFEVFQAELWGIALQSEPVEGGWRGASARPYWFFPPEQTVHRSTLNQASPRDRTGTRITTINGHRPLPFTGTGFLTERLTAVLHSFSSRVYCLYCCFVYSSACSIDSPYNPSKHQRHGEPLKCIAQVFL